jgi:hypothetical protein
MAYVDDASQIAVEIGAGDGARRRSNASGHQYKYMSSTRTPTGQSVGAVPAN